MGMARQSDGHPAGHGHAGGAVVPAKVRAPRVRWLPRERLDKLLPQLWTHRLGLVVAPAGSGKTTLLAGWAASSDHPVAWYRAESTDGTEAALVACLEAAFATAVASLPRGWRSIEDGAAALEATLRTNVLLIVDDLHTLTGSPAEAAFERFVDYAPPTLAVLAGSRTLPAFNLSRRRVSGALLEIGGDDLRFRSWEVERLFRDFYEDALRPDELARLARRTEGWSAGLQLFHLATRGKPRDERVRILAGLGSSSRFVRDYLARNVVAELPDELRNFLVRTSVLRRLSGPLCDALLGRTGSRALLEELERRSVFTVALDDEGTFRYHEVLRSHLEAILVAESGESGARAQARRAGELLVADGAVAEALAAFSRAEDWSAVDELLEEHGSHLVDGHGAWIDTLPPALLVQDPWLTLATARRHRAEGRWAQAITAYGNAEALFGGGDPGAVCRRERAALSAWLDPHPTPGTDWTGWLRAAVAREPLARRAQGSGTAAGAPRLATSAAGSGVGDMLAGGLAALIAGRVRDARLLLDDAARGATDSPTLGTAAALGGAVAGLLAGDARGAVEAEAAVAAAERLGVPWLAQVGRAALAMARTPIGSEYGRADAAAVRHAAGREHDEWAEALAALAEGWAALDQPTEAVEPLEIAITRFRSLGAASLEAWARSLAAGCLARTDAPNAREVALAAEAFARAAGTPGPQALAYAALALSDEAHASELRALAAVLFEETGLAEPRVFMQADVGQSAADAWTAGAEQMSVVPPPLEICCFGAFAISVAGRQVDLQSLKPRPRAVLRLLAVNAGRPVHREVIQDALWREADPTTGARSLHVALSALRRVLEPGAGDREILVRDGDAYRLAIPAGSRVDVIAFDEALTRARAARTNDHLRMMAYRAAVDVYAGDLLPEDGPADWIVARRDRARADYVEAAAGLAQLVMADRPAEAAAVCATALSIDPYHDPLWRLVIEARERDGDVAAAASARASYARMLAELGLPAGPTTVPRPATEPRSTSKLRPATSQPVTSLRGTPPP
jgi:DNA-binding SARP family transcriptional activator